MKRIALLFAFLLVFVSANAEKLMTVKVTSRLISNDSVGEDWLISHVINGTEYFNEDTEDPDRIVYLSLIKGTKDIYESKSDSVVIRDGKLLTIFITVMEDEKKPDIETVEISRKISSADYKKGFEVTTEVTVVEDAGRYKGCKAVWEITYEFIP